MTWCHPHERIPCQIKATGQVVGNKGGNGLFLVFGGVVAQIPDAPFYAAIAEDDLLGGLPRQGNDCRAQDVVPLGQILPARRKGIHIKGPGEPVAELFKIDLFALRQGVEDQTFLKRRQGQDVLDCPGGQA